MWVDASTIGLKKGDVVWYDPDTITVTTDHPGRELLGWEGDKELWGEELPRRMISSMEELMSVLTEDEKRRLESRNDNTED